MGNRPTALRAKAAETARRHWADRRTAGVIVPLPTGRRRWSLAPPPLLGQPAWRAQHTAARTHSLAGGGLRAEQPARVLAALPDAAVRGGTGPILLRPSALCGTGPVQSFLWSGRRLAPPAWRLAPTVQAHAQSAAEQACLFVCLFVVRVRRVVFVLSPSVPLHSRAAQVRTHALRSRRVRRRGRVRAFPHEPAHDVLLRARARTLVVG